MYTFRFLISAFMVFALVGCSAPSGDVRYIYSDGSGNAYRISETSLEYDPVRPEESSSGVYDGGEAVLRELSEEQYEQIQKLLDQALGSTSDHIDQRVMLSGQISVIDDEERSSVILSPGSEAKDSVEILLRRFLDEL